jgi:ribonuclease PH
MRADGRRADELRAMRFEVGWKSQGEGSCLVRCGNTAVLCVASVDEGVKDFLRGRAQGWVTAEYLMHPRAGARRQSRDGYNGRPLSGRTQEIARLIGRSLRAVVDLPALGERTITLDCDVLEADGGTRTASVNGAMVALACALNALRRKGTIARPALLGTASAVSAGVVAGASLLDLAYREDHVADMDLNLVADDQGRVIELQCSAESRAVPRAVVDGLVSLSLQGVAEIRDLQRRALRDAGVDLDALLAPA